MTVMIPKSITTHSFIDSDSTSTTMSHNHEGVSCDSCLQNSFRGRRYKCLLCYDFDLCSTCYESGITKQQHTVDHPMQCILPRGDNDLYYGGEPLSGPEQPQSYTCPVCCKMGFTYVTLAGHVSKNHGENLLEVICPVCATVPGGDPNRMTEDLARHLTLDHHSTPREIPLLDDGIAIRVHDARRVPHPHPGFRGRTRPRRSNMQFNPGPLSSRTSALREPVDPIAELLSHLSGVRRTASNSGSGAFQQFQMQWQIDRHVHATRQHLERLSQHQTRSLSVERKLTSNTDATGLAVMANVHAALSAQPAANIQPTFLLAGSLDELSLTEAAEINRQNRSQFLQELMISTIAKSRSKPSMALSVDQEDMCRNFLADVELISELREGMMDSESTEKEEGGVDYETIQNDQSQNEKVEKSSSE